MEAACGKALADVISALQPCVVVGVGTYAGARCTQVRAVHVRYRAQPDTR